MKRFKLVLKGLSLNLLFCGVAFAGVSGLPIGDMLQKGLDLAVYVGYFGIAIGIVVFLIMSKLGSRESALAWGVGTIVAGAIIANVETIMSWFGFTGGVNF